MDDQIFKITPILKTDIEKVLQLIRHLLPHVELPHVMNILQIKVDIVDIIQSDLSQHLEDSNAQTEDVEAHSLSRLQSLIRPQGVHNPVVVQDHFLCLCQVNVVDVQPSANDRAYPW